MRSRAKKQIRKRGQASPRKGSRKVKRSGSGLATRKKQFAKMIWPRINASTKFVELLEYQATVTYALPSGEDYVASLKWFGVSHGSRIFGHYDDEHNVCYVGKFVEG